MKGLDQLSLSYNDDPYEDLEFINQALEISSYEALWIKYKTVHKMAKIFRTHAHALPSKVASKVEITRTEIEEVRNKLRKILPFDQYSALFYGDFDYPNRLRVAKNPIEVLYYQGNLDLLSSKKIVSIVGARKATKEGISRAKKLTKMLVEEGYIIMSGLAEGIDTAAHTATIEAGGETIAVIGTPLHEVYPKFNTKLQSIIASKHLLASQVPFYLHSQKDWRGNRLYFPERNITMSALSHATVIIEASETSGTHYQARAAISQKRRLFILNSCFKRGLKWPNYYLKKGAHKVVTGKEILAELEKETI